MGDSLERWIKDFYKQICTLWQQREQTYVIACSHIRAWFTDCRRRHRAQYEEQASRVPTGLQER